MASKKRPAWSARSSDHLALRYYRLGRKLLTRDVVLDEEFERLATQLGLKAGADAWYKSIRLAKLFKPDESELESLCRLREDSRRITWSHMVELMQLPSAKQRERFAALAVRDNLGCATLRVEIRKATHWTSHRPGAGRKRRVPRSEPDAVWQAIREIERLNGTLEWLLTKSKRRLSRQMKDRLSDVINSLLKSLKEVREFLDE